MEIHFNLLFQNILCIEICSFVVVFKLFKKKCFLQKRKNISVSVKKYIFIANSTHTLFVHKRKIIVTNILKLIRKLMIPFKNIKYTTVLFLFTDKTKLTLQISVCILFLSEELSIQRFSSIVQQSIKFSKLA